MAQALLDQYDANKNGSLDGAELDACPAIKNSLAAIDTNKDKAVSKDELAFRFNAYQKAGISATAVGCTVRLNNAPLVGATVTFTPEDCMMGKIKGGKGTSDATGNVPITADGTNVPGLQSGIYKITVSKTGPGGEELPAKYNSKTTLGHEVFSTGRGGGTSIELNLTK